MGTVAAKQVAARGNFWHHFYHFAYVRVCLCLNMNGLETNRIRFSHSMISITWCDCCKCLFLNRTISNYSCWNAAFDRWHLVSDSQRKYRYFYAFDMTFFGFVAWYRHLFTSLLIEGSDFIIQLHRIRSCTIYLNSFIHVIVFKFLTQMTTKAIKHSNKKLVKRFSPWNRFQYM